MSSLDARTGSSRQQGSGCDVAFTLALMPAAILVVGWTLGIVGLIWTGQVVATADHDLVQRIVRGALAVLGIAGALGASFLGLRWTTLLVGSWKVKGAPLWPRCSG